MAHEKHPSAPNPMTRKTDPTSCESCSITHSSKLLSRPFCLGPVPSIPHCFGSLCVIHSPPWPHSPGPMLKCQDGQNIRVARGGGRGQGKKKKLIATPLFPSSSINEFCQNINTPCLTPLPKSRNRTFLSSPKDSQLSPARADKSSLWRQKSGQCGFKRRWGWVKVDCKEAQENFGLSLWGWSFWVGYTWESVFVKTDVYT